MKENILKKGAAQFTLLGRAKVNNYTYNLDTKSDSGYIYNRLNLGVDCGNGNIVYVELMGGYNPEIGKEIPLYVHGKKQEEDGKFKDDFNNRFQIAWIDRMDDSILKDVGDKCFVKIGLEKDVQGKTVTERFLSGYDAISYLENNLTDGMIVKVMGNLEYSNYNETTQMKKVVTHIFLQNETTDPETFYSTFTQTFLLGQDSLATKKNEEKNTLDVYAYVVEYIGKYNGEKIGQNVALPKTFEIELDKYTDTQWEMLKKLFFVGKKGWYSELVVEGELREGATTIATTANDLPDDLKALVACGVFTEEDAITKMAITGTRDKRMIWRKPLVSTKLNDDGTAVLTKTHYEVEKFKTGEMVFFEDVVTVDESKINQKPEGSSAKTITPDDVKNVVVDGAGEINLDFLFNQN